MEKDWITDKLRLKVRKVFEPRYQRPLLDSEVEEIATNLASFMENFANFKWRNLYGKYTRV